MASKIHPTAIVSSRATIGDDCEIGPYCIIGDQVTVGCGTRLQSHVVLDGDLTLGERCTIYPFACIGKQTQDLKYRGGVAPVIVGHDTTLREYVTIHMPTAPVGVTRVGHHCNILAYSHVAHDCLVGDHVIMSNSTNLGGHVVVEDRVVMGGLIGVHQFVRIGRMCMVGACSKVAQDLPPFMLADGNPAMPRAINKIGMQRNGCSDASIREATHAFRLIYRSGVALEAALDALSGDYPESSEIEQMTAFIRGSERGIARPRERD